MSPATLPRVRTVPLSGSITPEMCLSSVDLPEPFRPSSATVSPCCTSRSTSWSAWNFFERSPLRPVNSHTMVSLRDRVCRSTNCLLIFFTSIATDMLQLLRETALEPTECPLAQDEEQERNYKPHGDPQRQQTRRDGGGAVGGGQPERIVEGLDADGDRVDLVHRVPAVAELVPHHGPRVHDWGSPGGHHQQHVHDVLEVTEVDVGRAEQQPQPGGEHGDNDEARRRGCQLEQRGLPADHRQAATRTASCGTKCTADTQTEATGNSSRGR